MRKLNLLLGCLFFAIGGVQAKVKTIEIANASDTVVKVAIYTSGSPNQIGTAVTTVVELAIGKGWASDKLKFDVNTFINAVLITKKGNKIIVDSHMNQDNSPSKLVFNITNLKNQTIDQEEVKRMNRFLEEQVNSFKEKNNMVIKMDDNAFAAIQEYLGAIVIVDTTKSTPDHQRIRKLITARQLGINNSISFSGGRNIQSSYYISKDFNVDSNAKFPGVFDADLDFRSADLLEIKYSIINLGPILYHTQENVSAVDLIKKYDDTTTELVFASIANTIENCSKCTIFQINRVLTFEGIAITGKRYKKSDFGVSGSAGSVVTGDGTFKFEEGSEYSDLTSSKVIAVSMGSEDLSTSIFTTVLGEIDKDITKRNNEKSNTQTILTRLDNEIAQLQATKSKYEKFISRSKSTALSSN